ncbi:hypothetical protein [Novosphingobium sp.]|uniref:hypothetical protein n=1 Tax=Novosphingobium sp. TaxID=1874826 RepID=UPI003341D397
MFIGHYAPAFVASGTRNGPPLGLGLFATQLIDVAFFSFAMVGIEHYRLTPQATATNWLDLYDMPYTHSLLGASCWGLALALVALAVWHNRAMAVMIAALVVSHWLLDLLVHRPDLTLAGGLPLLGLGLWNVPVLEKPIELAITFGSLAFYLGRTRPVARWARLVLVLLVAELLIFQAIDWFGARTTQLEIGQQELALFAYAAVIVTGALVGLSRQAKV